MPTYTFKNKETGETIEKVLRISELSKWKEENPDWESVLGAPAFATGSMSNQRKAGSEWNDLLTKVKKGSGRGNTIKT